MSKIKKWWQFKYIDSMMNAVDSRLYKLFSNCKHDRDILAGMGAICTEPKLTMRIKSSGVKDE
jgi:hypothetical protein